MLISSDLKPVYTAEQVAELLKLRVNKSVLKQFRTPPEASARRISVWHPGLPLMGQATLPVVRDRNLLWVRPDLQTRDFALAPVQAGYNPVCLPAPDTARLGATAQEAVVAPFGETACPVAIGTWTWLVHFLATGESLGRGLWMRCLEPTSPGSRVGLSAFAGRLSVFDCWVDSAVGGIRLASLGTSGQGNLDS